MRNLIDRFIREEDGMEFVEWAIVAALFALVGAVVWEELANAITARLGDVQDCIENGGGACG